MSCRPVGFCEVKQGRIKANARPCAAAPLAPPLMWHWSQANVAGLWSLNSGQGYVIVMRHTSLKLAGSVRSR